LKQVCGWVALSFSGFMVAQEGVGHPAGGKSPGFGIAAKEREVRLRRPALDTERILRIIFVSFSFAASNVNNNVRAQQEDAVDASRGCPTD
jgi:hypothetical protein